MTTNREIAELREAIASLREENAGLRALVHEQAAQIADLSARLGKDRHNSGKPPASDGLRKRTPSPRPASGKRSGGQIGQRGQTLRQVPIPDEVVMHRPVVCAHCLEGVAGVIAETRQVQDHPPSVRVVVTAHPVEEVACPRCGHPTRGPFPAQVPAPTP